MLSNAVDSDGSALLFLLLGPTIQLWVASMTVAVIEKLRAVCLPLSSHESKPERTLGKPDTRVRYRALRTSYLCDNTAH